MRDADDIFNSGGIRQFSARSGPIGMGVIDTYGNDVSITSQPSPGLLDSLRVSASNIVNQNAYGPLILLSTLAYLVVRR